MDMRGRREIIATFFTARNYDMRNSQVKQHMCLVNQCVLCLFRCAVITVGSTRLHAIFERATQRGKFVFVGNNVINIGCHAFWKFSKCYRLKNNLRSLPFCLFASLFGRIKWNFGWNKTQRCVSKQMFALNYVLSTKFTIGACKNGDG